MTTITDTRLANLAGWVGRQLDRETISLEPLGGDAGARRYFAIVGVDHLLAVDAPPATENTMQFVRVAQLLDQHHITVPEIAASDPEQGFVLIEYWQGGVFGAELNAGTAPLLYGEALLKLLAIQQIPVSTAEFLPIYDAAFIRRELALLNEWFLQELLGMVLTPAELELLEQLFSLLEASALAQPQVVMHRDYHSRNLVFGRSGQLATIDFQDAVLGPLTYDVVSLLKDCYYRLPSDQARQWALAYGDMAIDAGIMPPLSADTYLRYFDWMGLQRHLKVLGIFSRLHLRDGKPGYLNDLPRVLGYVMDTFYDYPELKDFSNWFEQRVMPLCRARPWYTQEANL